MLESCGANLLQPLDFLAMLPVARLCLLCIVLDESAGVFVDRGGNLTVVRSESSVEHWRRRWALLELGGTIIAVDLTRRL
jgi:hypothetical protein